MMLLKSFFRRIIKDFRQKKLMPLKLIFFVHTSTLYILYPYLTIHMRELGINVEETAIMSAITPFVAIIMPPIAGLLADRIGNFKILLSLFSALGGAAALLLLLVPVGRVTVQLPETIVLGARCPAGSELTYTINLKHPCDSFLDPQIDATLQSCGYSCPVKGNNKTELNAKLNAILMSRNYSIDIFERITARNVTHYYEISESDVPEAMKLVEDAREIRKLKNLEFYKVAIRQLSKNSLFFPVHEPQLFELACNVEENRSVCSFNFSGSSAVSSSANWSTTRPAATGAPSGAASGAASGAGSMKISLKPLELSEHDVLEEQRHYLGSISNASRPTKCDEAEAANGELATVRVLLPDAPALLDECTRTCLFTSPRAQLCTNAKMQIEYNVSLTFWSYLCIRVFIGMIGGTAFAMFEGAVIAILREQKADYGLQRIYGSIGGMISSPLSGLLIDYASGNKGYADFRPAFYLYATLKIFSGLIMLMINLEFKAPATNVVNDVLSVLKNIEVVALLTACFILGTAWGYIESFLFWLLEDLGASRSLMGITITVGGIAGLPLLVLSGPIISRIGHANVLFIGFVFYAIRLLGYSLIYNPWLCLIFESLESVTSSLSFTAAVTYAAKLSTSTTDSSIQGLLGGLYYGVGKGSGSLIGGYLMKAFGTRPTYQIFALVTLLTGLLYLLFNVTYLSKRPQVEGNDIVKKKPKVPMSAAVPESNGKISKIQEAEASKSCQEAVFESEPYIVDDLEAVNNAKNLDIAESIINGEKEEKKEAREENQRHARINPAFQPDDPGEACQTTAEKEERNDPEKVTVSRN